MAKSTRAKQPKQRRTANEDVKVIDETGAERTFKSALWNNLPQTQKDRFKTPAPAETKKPA